MPSLIAKSPLFGQGSLSLGDATLSEQPWAPITSIAPLAGGAKALSKALKAVGLAMPGPNTCAMSEGRVIVWTGLDQAYLIGARPAGLDGAAALTDQSDGWAQLRLEGVGAADVLARLVPVDLRGLAAGQALRAPLNHMNCILFATQSGQVDLLVFRSMARTAWTELAEAMAGLNARAHRPV